jgi:hypothetical protein
VRLWSLHPRYLDRQGLIACWRETLLAQSVLVSPGGGYSRHPQLSRFTAHDRPLDVMAHYLGAYLAEADARGYRFSRDKIVGDAAADVDRIQVSTGQLDYEWAHLSAKLAARSPEVAARWSEVTRPEAHPWFVIIDGPIAEWERVSVDRGAL